MAVVSDRKLARVRFPGSDEVKFYDADVTAHSEYYPFGMTSRSGSDGGNYRYGYQGSEKDDEIKGGGNSYTTFFRQLDSRLGRWLSVDPKVKASETPYASMGNNPIFYNDIMGDTFDPAAIYDHTTDSDGNVTYTNEADVKAFEIWASSKSGRKFILDHAEEGFELNGVFVKDLHIKATNDGKAHKKGVDVDFYFFGSGKDDPPYTPEGSTGVSFPNDNRMQITINLDPNSNESSNSGIMLPSIAISIVRNITHETLYHADYFSKLWQSGKMTKNNWKHFNSLEVAHTRQFLNTDFYDNTGREVMNFASNFIYSKTASNSFFRLSIDKPPTSLYILNHMSLQKIKDKKAASSSVIPKFETLRRTLLLAPSKENINYHLEYGM